MLNIFKKLVDSKLNDFGLKCGEILDLYYLAVKNKAIFIDKDH